MTIVRDARRLRAMLEVFAVPDPLGGYIGCKQKIVEWIMENIPEESGWGLDAFSGSSVVGYNMKEKGMKVWTNDALLYPYHQARALVQNSKEKLSDDEIKALGSLNGKAGYITEIYNGVFLSPGILQYMDSVREKLEELDGFKRDIALAALCKLAIRAKSHGRFSGKGVELTPEKFKESYPELLGAYNDLIIEGDECEAHNENIFDLLPKFEGDFVYYDPPYVTEFSNTRYDRDYNFLEVVCIGPEVELLSEEEQKKTRKVDVAGDFITKGTAVEWFERLFEASKGIPFWILSYPDHSIPTDTELKKMIPGKVEQKSKDFDYRGAHEKSKNRKEHIFIVKV